jgi:hypothetical protein
MGDYYLSIAGKQHDRALFESAVEAVTGRGDGRISRADTEKLLARVLDKGPGPDVYTDTEKRTVKLIRDTMGWTPAGDRHFRREIRSAAARRSWEVRAAQLKSPTLSKAEFIEKLYEAAMSSRSRPPRCSADGVPLVNYKKVSDQLRSDLSRIRFNTENTEHSGHYRFFPDFLGVKALDNGTPYLAMSSGGDWEFPLCYVVYWDGEQLRGHIPKEGNIYNKTHNAAFGNQDEDEEIVDLQNQLDALGIPLPRERDRGHYLEYADLLGDKDRLLQDIENHISR